MKTRLTIQVIAVLALIALSSGAHLPFRRAEKYFWGSYTYKDYCADCWYFPNWLSCPTFLPYYSWYNFDPNYWQFYNSNWYNDFGAWWFDDSWFNYTSFSNFVYAYDGFLEFYRTNKAKQGKPSSEEVFLSKAEPLVKELQRIKKDLFNDSKKNMAEFRESKAKLQQYSDEDKMKILKILAEEELLGFYHAHNTSK